MEDSAAMPDPSYASPGDYDALPYDPDPAYIALGKHVGSLRAKFFQAQHSWQGQLQIPARLFGQALVQVIHEIERQRPANATFCRTLRPNSVTKNGLAALRLSVKRPGRYDAHCEVVLRPHGPDILAVVSSYVFFRRSLARKALWILNPITGPFVGAATMVTSLLSNTLANALENATSSIPRATSDAGIEANALAETALRALHFVRSRLTQTGMWTDTDFPDVI